MSLPFRPRKRLGQNFLVDPNIARKIVAAVGPTDGRVIEIGPGTGALTGLLIDRYPALTAVEVDARAVAILSEKYPELDVRTEDVLDLDWTSLADESGPLVVVGNLPYSITSPILFKLIDNDAPVATAVLMMQLEVARRLVAVPRTKAYGILSVQLQLAAEVELLFTVPPTVFRPRPDVTSAVVRLRMRRPNQLDDNVRTIVRAAFNQRRKKLRNSLGVLLAPGGISLPEPWASKRAEELTPQEFVELAGYLAPRF